jgi:hypothetical protein
MAIGGARSSRSRPPLTGRSEVRVSEDFFRQLSQLGPTRGMHGEPSSTDYRCRMRSDGLTDSLPTIESGRDLKLGPIRSTNRCRNDSWSPQRHRSCTHVR